MNLYVYCKNDPVRYVDPSGHSAECGRKKNNHNNEDTRDSKPTENTCEKANGEADKTRPNDSPTENAQRENRPEVEPYANRRGKTKAERPNENERSGSKTGLPKIRIDIHEDLLKQGLRCNGTSQGGYVTYMHPDEWQ